MENNNNKNDVFGFCLKAGEKTGLGIDFLTSHFEVQHILIFSTVLFLLGLFGVSVVSSNLIVALMALEVMFLGLTVDFLVIAHYHMDVTGYMFVIAILTLAGAESAIALAIFVNVYKAFKSLDIKYVSKMSG